ILNNAIDVSYYRKLKAGADVINEKGELIANESVTFPPSPPKSYAFCSDTAYFPEIVPQLEGVTALYHESTFLDEHEHLCKKTRHCTAKHAAAIAKQANVEQLILGHFSTRYDNMELFKQEAQTIFKNTDIADDFKVFEF